MRECCGRRRKGLGLGQMDNLRGLLDIGITDSASNACIRKLFGVRKRLGEKKKESTQEERGVMGVQVWRPALPEKITI